MRLLRILLVAAACAGPLRAPASAAADDPGRRVALVVGNGAYAHTSPLPNPPNDAAAVARSLRELGFEVVEGVDLDHRGTLGALADFADRLEGARVGLFFYAGHGLQVGGENYLVPVDATLEREAQLHFQAVPVRAVLGAMESEVPTRLVLLDACRDNPLARTLARGMGATRSAALAPGLADLRAASGTLIAYATAPGDVALDGRGRHSPFTAALLEHMAVPGLVVEQMLNRVRGSVLAATDGRQVPWDSSSLSGDFYFRPPAAGEAPAAAAPPPAPVLAAAPPAAARLAEPDPAPPAPPPARVHRTATEVPGPHLQGSTRVAAEVTSLAREAGTLMLRVAVANEGGTDANAVPVYAALHGAFLRDPASGAQLQPLKRPDGLALASAMSATGVPAGERRDLFVQFPEPPPGAGALAVYLQGFPPLLGVPLTAAPGEAAGIRGRPVAAAVPGPHMQGSTRVAAEVASLALEGGTLMLRLAVTNEGGTDANAVPVYSALQGAFARDPASGRITAPLKGPNGTSLASDMSATGVRAGERRELFVQFPEPPAATRTLDVYLDGFLPMLGVPVAR